MCAKPSDLLNDLSNDFTQLLDNKDSCDVTIFVGEEPDMKELKAHSLILRIRSPHLKTLLSNERSSTDGRNSVIIKHTIAPAVFESILRYIYTGAIDLDGQDGPSILKILVAAEELDLNRLINYIQNFLIEEKTQWLQEDPVQILDLVFQHPACKSLRDYCLQAICQRPELIFNSGNFLSIDEPMLILLLTRDDLAMDEIDVYEHLMKWGIAQNSQLTSDISKWTSEDYAILEATVHQLIPLVRWFQIPPADFSRKVRPYKKLLPDALYEDILSYHLDSESPIESTVLQPRVPFFDSTTITSNIVALLATWIDCKSKDASYKVQKNPYDFKLAFRASRDGFNHTTFHRRCDNKGPSILVAKLAKSSILIGGYNPLDWGLYGFQQSRTSFLFMLDKDKDLDSVTISRVINPGAEAICCDATKGPTFGSGPDFAINNDKTWTSVPKSYPSIFGDVNGTIEDYEVFTVCKKTDRSTLKSPTAETPTNGKGTKKLTKFWRLQ